MPTFLTTRKMDPALAARIEASIRGGRSEAKWAPRLVSIVRLGVVVAIVAVTVSVLVLRRRDRLAFEASRATLAAKVHAESASLTPEQLATVARVEAWLEKAAGSYEGDFVADELRGPGALAAVLARPVIYVRGALGALGSAKGVADAAAGSFKDPLVACLLEPPPTRTEKALLTKVRAAYGRNAEEHTANVRRLEDAEVGLPFLQPPWGERIAMALEPEDLEKLGDAFERAPIEGAKRAAKAGLLLFAIDEPGDLGVPAELDGERPHDVRVELVALDPPPARALLRIRKRVDPGWISGAKRAELASGLDGCALAMDVSESALGGATARAGIEHGK